MNAQQPARLLDLASEWTAIVHDSAAVARMQEIRAGLDDTWFAWSGPTTAAVGKNGTAYYRIQGARDRVRAAGPTRDENESWVMCDVLSIDGTRRTILAIPSRISVVTP